MTDQQEQRCPSLLIRVECVFLWHEERNSTVKNYNQLPYLQSTKSVRKVAPDALNNPPKHFQNALAVFKMKRGRKKKFYFEEANLLSAIVRSYPIDGDPWNINVWRVKCSGLISIHVHQSYSFRSLRTVEDSIPGLIIREYLKTLWGVRGGVGGVMLIEQDFHQDNKMCMMEYSRLRHQALC